MSNEELEASEVNEQDMFAQLNITKILVGILEMQKEVTIPTSVLVSAVNEDKELQVDYNEDDKTFIFKLREKNAK